MSGPVLASLQLKRTISKTFRLLADEDCRRLLKLAQEGIQVGKATPKSLGMTERKYYRRLQQLIEANLVVKEGRFYRATQLGKVVLQTQVTILEEALANYHKLIAIQTLRNIPGLPDNDIDKVSKILLSEGSYLSRYLTSSPIEEVITSYEHLVTKTIEGLNRAKKEAKLATRYVDERVIKALIEVSQRGIKVSVITDLQIILKRMKMLKIKADVQEYAKLFYPLKDTKVAFRYFELPFSFLVLDGEEAGVELVDPVFPENFIIGFAFKGDRVPSMFSEKFDSLWSQASEDPMNILSKAPVNGSSLKTDSSKHDT